MSKSKLNQEQKAYLKSLDSKKKRKKQKKFFKLKNKSEIVLENYYRNQKSPSEYVVLNFELDGAICDKNSESLFKGVLRDLTEPKLYTQEQMMDCFNESRLTNLIIGFKHDSFAAYLKSIE